VIFSRGLWRLRHEVEVLSGARACRPAPWPARDLAVAGWGHKPTAATARRYARHFGLAYLAVEDGFLRSLRPGPAQKPSSMVMDRSGIYYDASGPSDLEHILQHTEFSAADWSAAQELLQAIAAFRLSKYNDAADQLDGSLGNSGQPLVLLIDQTRGDASVAGGLASEETFRAMVAAARAENPGARLVAKLHPETASGAKGGYLAGLAAEAGLAVLARQVNPHDLFGLAPKVYTVSSQFGFEAALAGLEVHCFGLPFYAGWGLTRDRQSTPRRRRRLTVEELAAGVYLHYGRYFDAWTRRPVTALEAAGQLDFLRRQYLGNRQPVIGYGIARWKRRAVAAMLTGPAGPPRFIANRAAALAAAQASGAALAAWGRSALALRAEAEAAGVRVLAVEDGFLRSRGLGAAFVPPRSLVFDASGLHYDPTRPSDVERLLAETDFSAEDLARAERLQAAMVSAGITKYNLQGGATLPPIPAGRPPVLVVGQVADDAAVELAAGPAGVAAGNVNAWLLRQVRARYPGAYIIFKPHPDVEVLGRTGRLTVTEERDLTDWVARDQALLPLLAQVQRVATFGSLAGLEALLRDVPVTVYGQPFYAGWGLTEDLASQPRRGRKLPLAAVVAAAYLRYARYWDPESGLPCPPETALARLSAAQAGDRGLSAGILRLAGRSVISVRRLAAMLRPGRAE
jgi:capsular polysaccharide export protein